MAPATTAKNNRILNSPSILTAAGAGVRAVAFHKNQAIFTQGDPVGDVFYIQKGTVRLTVVSQYGREATMGKFGEGEFFGEASLAEQPLRLGSATAISDGRLLQIDKKAMMLALQKERTLSDLFIMQLLARIIRYQENLVDQLFDPSEIRLARVLLLLADFGKGGAAESLIPEINQDTLANMADTSRVRVRSLMKKFSKSGFVAYSKNGLQVHSSLLGVVLRD
jgi:CRP/FNR family cyclic AMP-dependent transcriptional regulator